MEYNLNYKLIGKRIKNKRLQKNMTQDALSEKVGIGVQHMSKIENGKAKLSLLCLVSLANGLDTTVDNLLMDNVPAASIPHFLGEIKTIFDDCTAEEIFLIAEVAKTLKKNIRLKNMQPAEQRNIKTK